MAGKKKYYKLDDIGIVGKQDKKSPLTFAYHAKKTGDAIRQYKMAAAAAAKKARLVLQK